MSEVKEQETVKDENVYTLLFPYATPDGREVREITLRDRLKARDIRELSLIHI